jgi:hypothetical protein
MIKKDKEKPVEKKKEEDWMTKKWRPLMAMMYMTCCLADFFLFPIMFTIVQFWETQAANDAFRQWVPITLQGGGLFHVAMGAVLGVTAYGRTQEKLGGAAGAPLGTPTGVINAGSQPQPSSGFTTPGFSAPAPTGGFASPAPVVTNSWGSQPLGAGSGFGSPSPAPAGFGGGAGFGAPASAEVVTGFGGKPAPVIPPFPER